MTSKASSSSLDWDFNFGVRVVGSDKQNLAALCKTLLDYRIPCDWVVATALNSELVAAYVRHFGGLSTRPEFAVLVVCGLEADPAAKKAASKAGVRIHECKPSVTAAASDGADTKQRERDNAAASASATELAHALSELILKEKPLLKAKQTWLQWIPVHKGRLA